MNEKRLNARLVNKHDIQSNWEKATNFIPMQGEIICYDVDENYTYERFKIGDGITNVNDLPFVVIQSDWNQTDGTAVDFIKNKPDIESLEAEIAKKSQVQIITWGADD